MARYLYRNCPRCAGYLGIVLREPGRNTPLQAVNGHCLKCDYRLAGGGAVRFQVQRTIFLVGWHQLAL